MPNYDTDTQLQMRFDLDFYAATQNDADNIARNTINRIFGAAMAGLMQVTDSSDTPLTSMAISGDNYHYQYDLNIRMGHSEQEVFNTIFAATAADALAALQANAQRITNITNFPLKVIWLKVEAPAPSPPPPGP